ncbi:reprolysin-like metallopeptidase [Tenacibaculum amylolyticum]|uniref:reprolysin-like metallopeptidase n=1 Tax=Tenacibaculum amylolyticum TaxID=104269 RepID=UPI003892ED41
MKEKLLLTLLMASTILCAQNNNFWKKENVRNKIARARKNTLQKKLPDKNIYSLDFERFKQALKNVPVRNSGKTSNVIVAFPNSAGVLENYRITETPVLHLELAAKYPNIKSYSGVGIDNPLDKIRFSVSSKGLQSMRLSINKPTIFIEPYATNSHRYSIYKKFDKPKEIEGFECDIHPHENRKLKRNSVSLKNANDGILRTYRIAVSSTGEYTAYHGGTKEDALAAINATITRVNEIFERDFNITMVIIANNDDVIYTDGATDPYSSRYNYNQELQTTLTNTIGEANYDIGHLFVKDGDYGNAGCIGCVCIDGKKGSGFSSKNVPEGDSFVDLVAHEMGHQFGANHTFSYRNEGTDVHMEPGSGSTIMSYAGTLFSLDVQSNRDLYFHAASIEQVTDYIKTTSCQVDTATGNTAPVVNAGNDFTIPKGTPFALTGVATDKDTDDILTYCWEQIDENDAATTRPNEYTNSGVAFRSYKPTKNPTRYFPRLETIQEGKTSWQWEAIPYVSRDLNFRLTVRDNRIGGGTNASDDVKITVNADAGPFVITNMNSNSIKIVGDTETITWDVAGTTANNINAQTVDILLSTDGGNTFPIVLANEVPNNGSYNITIPNILGNKNRIMVKASHHIFFDITDSNFIIGDLQPCTDKVPINLLANNIAKSKADISWNEVKGGSYIYAYKKATDTTWNTNNTLLSNTTISNLEPATIYEFKVKSVCPNNSTSNFSETISFRTSLQYCGANSFYAGLGYIRNVTLNTMNNTSSSKTYNDFTDISTTITKGFEETISITPIFSDIYPIEMAHGVWIDYNQNGVFTDPGELVWSQEASTESPVKGTFKVPTSAKLGNTTMRIILKRDFIPNPCDVFSLGEVEDYTVIIVEPDTEAPVLTLLGESEVTIILGDTYTDTGATAIDNVDGDISENITIAGTVDTNTIGSYALVYNVTDKAGNIAKSITRTVHVNLEGCQNGIDSYPYTESFETSFGLWTQDINDDIDWKRRQGITLTPDTGPNAAYQGRYYTYVDASKQGIGHPFKKATLYSPCFSLYGITNATVSFAYHMYGDPDIGSLNLELSDDDGQTWKKIWKATSDSKFNIWKTASVNLDQYVNKGIRFRFNRKTGASKRADVAIDAFKLSAINYNDFPVLTLQGAKEIEVNVGDTYTDNGATATDTTDGDISENIVITGNVDTRKIGTYILTYNVTDSDGNLAKPITRTIKVKMIECSNSVSNFPYKESFDLSFNSWVQEPNDDLDWIRTSEETLTRDTGPSAAYEGTHYMYVSAAEKGIGYPFKKAIIYSPCFDLSVVQNATVSFVYHMYGAPNLGDLKLNISEDGGNTWATIWHQSGDKGNAWKYTSVSLANYVGKTIRFSFVRRTGNTLRGDVAIDKFEIKTENNNVVSESKVLLNQRENESGFGIYPNPTDQFLYIITPSATARGINYVIYNYLGQEVKKGIAINYIDISDLKVSVYTLQLKRKGETKNLKFIKK